MPFDTDDEYALRSAESRREDYEDAARDEFDDPNLSLGGSIGGFLRAFGALPLDEVEQNVADLVRNLTPGRAGPAIRRRHLSDFIGFDPLPSDRSTGTLDITLDSTKSNSDFNPMFAAGSLILIDTDGNRYDLVEDVVLGDTATTEADASLRAQDTGPAGNISAGAIVDVEFVTSTAEKRWNDHVDEDNTTNDEAFSGGRNQETSAQYWRRFRQSNAALPGATEQGLPAALENARIGVDDADVVENAEKLTALIQEDVYDGTAATGTQSETIDASGGAGVNTKFAQKVTISDYRFLESLSVLVNFVSGTPELTMTLETDNAGEPSGTLLTTRHTKSGFNPNDGSLTGTLFDEFGFGAYPPDESALPIDIWLVGEATSGSFTVEGDSGGTAGDFMVQDDGGWANDANINRANLKLSSGVPGRATRVIVDAPDSAFDDIAEVLRLVRGIGSWLDGKDKGTDTKGREQRFETVTQVPVLFDITVTKTSLFGGDEDTIREVIVEYVGGTFEGDTFPGLRFGEKLVYNEVISRVLEDDRIQGLEDVSELLLDREDNVTGEDPANLDAADDDNLDPAAGERFVVENPATDILVQINSA